MKSINTSIPWHSIVSGTFVMNVVLKYWKKVMENGNNGKILLSDRSNRIFWWWKVSTHRSSHTVTIFVTVGPFMNVVLRYQKEIQTEQQDYLYSVCFQVNSNALTHGWDLGDYKSKFLQHYNSLINHRWWAVQSSFNLGTLSGVILWE